MRLSSRLFLLTLLYYCFISCDNKKLVKRKAQNILSLLGYLNGYKIGENYAFLLPVLVVPSINPPNEIIFHKIRDENPFNNTVQIIKPVQSNSMDFKEEASDIEVNFRQALNRGSVGDNKDIEENSNMNETFRQNNIENDVAQTESNTERYQITVTAETTIDITKMEQPTIIEFQTTTESNGLYPSPVHNNDVFNTLTLTTDATKENLQLPNMENKWKNFTDTANLSITVSNTSSLITNVTSIGANTNMNPYPAPLYSNLMIDQLSITTNSYTNEESPLPPPQDDRWRRFSSLSKISTSTHSGFRPLAGLYYDGFLNKNMIKMPGFLPNNYYYY